MKSLLNKHYKKEHNCCCVHVHTEHQHFSFYRRLYFQWEMSIYDDNNELLTDIPITRQQIRTIAAAGTSVRIYWV